MQTLQEQLQEIKQYLNVVTDVNTLVLGKNIVARRHMPYIDRQPKNHSPKTKGISSFEYEKCSECGVNIRLDRLGKHMNKHIVQKNRAKKLKAEKRKARKLMRERKKLQKINVGKIRAKRNPIKDQQPDPISQRPKTTMTPRQASKALQALRSQGSGGNQEIQEYINRVPEPNKIGSFGIPQDKYRWGFYGHATMSYDIWGRPEK